ncbi:MAG: hypothetical protein JWQ09_5544 [Segetibacter sp.]|nr:hypothetical protein [Segetibacter sp.]
MTQQQLIKFNTFLLAFVRFSNSRAIDPIYRGENLDILYKKLGLDRVHENDSSHRALLERLFMIGDKSKNYFSKEIFGFNHKWSFGINDCSQTVLNFIFDSISDCAKKHPAVSVRQFFHSNSLFKEYFLDKRGNKKTFVSSIQNLPRNKQISIRNYYLKLLHQIGSINYRDRSNIISTSKNYLIANNFASGNCVQEGAIIHAWEPRISNDQIFKNHSLPKYRGRPYHFQDEISIIAGLFPHYIIGLEILSTGKLHLNPNIFSNEIDKGLFVDGMKIDQTSFEEIIQKTNYSRYFISNGQSYNDITV